MNALTTLQEAQEVRWVNRHRRLAFHPPQMSSAYVYHAAAGEYRFPNSADVTAGRAVVIDGTRYFIPTLDVVIIMPVAEVELTETGHVVGGWHVRTIGGKFKNTGITSMFAFANNNGSVFCEGMFLDCNGVPSDGWPSRWNQSVADQAGVALTSCPSITFQHCRIEKCNGSFAGVHGDCFQTQSDPGMSILRFEEVTFEGRYQGLSACLAGNGSVPAEGLWLRRCNSKYYDTGVDQALISYYLHDGDTTTRNTNSYPVHLNQVYATELPAAYVWEERICVPNTLHAWGPSDLGTDAHGDFLDFSSLGLQITGRIRRGQPPTGDFASAESVGLNYRSPWPQPPTIIYNVVHGADNVVHGADNVVHMG